MTEMNHTPKSGQLRLQVVSFHCYFVKCLFTDWSRTATQKTAKKLSATRLTPLNSTKSSQSNKSTSSTSYLVSDSSEQLNGIGKWRQSTIVIVLSTHCTTLSCHGNHSTLPNSLSKCFTLDGGQSLLTVRCFGTKLLWFMFFISLILACQLNQK